MSFGATHVKKTRRGRTVIKDTGIDVEKGEGFYGIVNKMLGTNRLLVTLNNGSEVQATFSNKFKKRIWIKVGDIVLINDSHEIEQKIDKDNKRSYEANAMIKKSIPMNMYFIKEELDEDEDEDEDENKDVSKTSKPEKTLTKRGTGEKIFTDPDELKKQFEELNIDDI